MTFLLAIYIFLISSMKWQKKCSKTTHSYNQFHNILTFFIFYQIFLSSQVKLCQIIIYKHGICKLPHELSNDLELRILGN